MDIGVRHVKFTYVCKSCHSGKIWSFYAEVRDIADSMCVFIRSPYHLLSLESQFDCTNKDHDKWNLGLSETRFQYQKILQFL